MRARAAEHPLQPCPTPRPFRCEAFQPPRYLNIEGLLPHPEHGIRIFSQFAGVKRRPAENLSQVGTEGHDAKVLPVGSAKQPTGRTR